MKSWLDKLRRRWSDYVGDRDLERAIRAEIVARGLPEGAAIRNVRLAAIERPGWVQVYEFDVEATPSGMAGSHRWLGVARDDGRRGAVVRLFDTPKLREQQFVAWSEGMIKSPSRR